MEFTFFPKLRARFKWHMKEINKMNSNEPSFYSSKRVKSHMAFIGGYYGMIHFLIVKLNDTPVMTTMEMCGWATLMFSVAGYHLNKTQEEKKVGNLTT